MMMHKFEFNPLRENTYLLWDEHTMEAAIIDAGMSDARERRQLQKFVSTNKLQLVMALQTHCHFDHIYGLPFLYSQYNLKPQFADREKDIYEAMPYMAQHYGIFPPEDLPPRGEALTDGQVLHVGSIDVQVIFTPGHTPGGVSFYLPSERIAFTGDTLFRGSMGRTDFCGNAYDERRSILDRLLTLPADTTLYPGHGPVTTVADERVTWGV